MQHNVMRPPFDVFLAHNTSDKLEIKRIAQALQQHGVSCWLDSEQIAPGDWFQDAIQDAIGNVGAAAVFIGTNGLGEWQTVERRSLLSRCIKDGLRVIPVLLPGVEAMPTEPSLLFLIELNFVKFEHVDDGEALRKLVLGITKRKPSPQWKSTANS